MKINSVTLPLEVSEIELMSKADGFDVVPSIVDTRQLPPLYISCWSIVFLVVV